MSQGIGAWPDKNDIKASTTQLSEYTAATYFLPSNVIWLQKNLHIYGYNIRETGIFDQQTRDVLVSFQMHFRSQKYDGMPDTETCALLSALIKKYYPSRYEEPMIEKNKRSTEDIYKMAKL